MYPVHLGLNIGVSDIEGLKIFQVSKYKGFQILGIKERDPLKKVVFAYMQVCMRPHMPIFLDFS